MKKAAIMKKCDKAEALIRSMLRDRYSIITACRWADKEYDLKTQYATIEGGLEVSIYYCRLGNSVSKELTFRRSPSGGYLNVVQFPKRPRLLDSVLYNFLEQCV